MVTTATRPAAPARPGADAHTDAQADAQADAQPPTLREYVPPRGRAPRVDSRQLSWWAEGADGVRDKELALVLTEAGEYELREEQPGDQVLLRVYTPSAAPNRMRPVEITFQAPGCEKIRIDQVADALFWTESAVEKFLFPYHAAQRLLTDEEMRRLKEDFRSERVAAIWHKAPSNFALLSGRMAAEEAVSVLRAEPDEGGEARLEWTGLRDYLAEPAAA